jgi:trehalose synthase
MRAGQHWGLEDDGVTTATVHLGQRRLEEYAALVAPHELAALRRLAEPLAGLRVLHLSASPFGSAVAETLAALVPLQRDLGLQADWLLLRADTARFWLALYDALSGATTRWERKERAGWLAYAERQAATLPPGYDVIVAHDPQALALAQALPTAAGRPRWVWHCHLDVSAALPAAWADVRQALQGYAAAVYPAPELVPADVPGPYQGVARPAIDPCAPKHQPLAPNTVTALLARLGLDPERPLVGQFAPIDQRYAPIAALGAYWLARREVPGLQIALVDGSPLTSARAQADLTQVAAAASGDPDIHLLTPEDGLGTAEVNALQRGAAVALQLAVPRGFGWGLAECQWKSKPAVVGRQGLLAHQVGDGLGGYVVDGAPYAAAQLLRLLREPALAAEMGRHGRARIARDHLITGLVGDYLDLLHHVTAPAVARARR